MPTLDMTPEALYLVVKRATTWEWSILWKDENGDPINNTGWSFTMNLKVEYDAVTPTLSLSTDEGSIVAAGASGYINFLVDPALTAIPSQRYVFDLIADTGSQLTPVAEGTVTVED